MKYDHLILRKIFKFVATRCQNLRLKCTKFNFDWGSASDLASKPYSTHPDFILLKEERGRGREGGVGEGEEKERREPQKLVYTPMSEIMKNIDCTTVWFDWWGRQYRHLPRVANTFAPPLAWRSIGTRNLKSLAAPIPEIWRGSQNLKKVGHVT